MPPSMTAPSPLSRLLPKRNDTAALPFVMDASKDPAPRVVSSLWAMMAVSTLFLFLRLYCKKIRSRGMWADDYLLLVSWLFLLVSNCLVTELMGLGFGKTVVFVAHMHTLSTANNVVNKIALALSKTSFAATMLRVSSGRQSVFVWFLAVSMNAVLATDAVVTWKAACDRPLDSYDAVLPGSCWRVYDFVVMAVVSNGYSALVDFVLSLLPWRMIWKLQMQRHEKVGVAVAMSLGIIAGLVGVIKVVKIATIAEGADIPYRLSLLFIWGQAEPNVAIVASSIPVLRVLCRDLCAASPPPEQGAGYLKSDAQSTFPPGIGMAAIETRVKGEEEMASDVLRDQESAPSSSMSAVMYAYPKVTDRE